MKKLFSLLAVLLSAVILSTYAFAADADAYTVYQKYVKKSKSISSMELSVVQKLSMVNGDQTIELTKQNASVKMIIKNDKLQMEMKIKDSATGETASAYFKDNYLYEKVGNEKFKIKMNTNDALANASVADTGLTREDLKDAKVEKVAGGTKITYKLKAADLNDALTSSLDGVDLPDNFKLKITGATTSMIIADDGMLQSMSSVVGVTIDDGNDSIKMRILQSMKVKSINTVDKIDFPADLNTYKTLK